MNNNETGNFSNNNGYQTEKLEVLQEINVPQQVENSTPNNNQYVENTNRDNNKTKIIIPVIFVILIIAGIFILLNGSKNNYLYKLEYTHNETNTYEILIKKDWKVLVKYNIKCSESTSNCKDEKKEFIVNLKNENKEKLKEFISVLFKDKENTIKTTTKEFSQYELNVLNALTSNDEDEFSRNIEKYDYKIVFLESFSTPYEYTILINGYEALVKTSRKNAEFKTEVLDSYTVEFLKDYKELFYTFKSNNFSQKNTLILYPKSSYDNSFDNISDQDLNLVKAIAHNDTSYIE